MSVFRVFAKAYEILFGLSKEEAESTARLYKEFSSDPIYTGERQKSEEIRLNLEGRTDIDKIQVLAAQRDTGFSDTRSKFSGQWSSGTQEDPWVARERNLWKDPWLR